jgi:hypothetical protein
MRSLQQVDMCGRVDLASRPQDRRGAQKGPFERADELLEMFDKLLRLTESRVRRKVDEKRRSTAGQRDELADLGQRLSVLLLDCASTGEVPFDPIRQEIGIGRLQAGRCACVGRTAAA